MLRDEWVVDNTCHWSIIARALNYTYENFAGGHRRFLYADWLLYSDVVLYLSAQHLYDNLTAFNAEIRCEEHNYVETAWLETQGDLIVCHTYAFAIILVCHTKFIQVNDTGLRYFKDST